MQNCVESNSSNSSVRNDTVQYTVITVLPEKRQLVLNDSFSLRQARHQTSLKCPFYNSQGSIMSGITSYTCVIHGRGNLNYRLVQEPRHLGFPLQPPFYPLKLL